MHKTASRSKATQAAVRRDSDAWPVRAHWVVVAFRRGTDNQGRDRVYRRVWTERFEDAANTRMELAVLGAGHHYLFAAVISRAGAVVHWIGATNVPDEWESARRGLNRGVDWRTGCTYARRESRRGRAGTAIEEHDDWRRTLEEVGRRG